jgi:hypothetical protein
MAILPLSSPALSCKAQVRLVDITQPISAVVVNGKLLDRSQLDRLLSGGQRFVETH